MFNHYSEVFKQISGVKKLIPDMVKRVPDYRPNSAAGAKLKMH